MVHIPFPFGDRASGRAGVAGGGGRGSGKGFSTRLAQPVWPPDIELGVVRDIVLAKQPLLSLVEACKDARARAFQRGCSCAGA
eukprot:1954669-Alexandrium_andersonii.AAC.1